MVFYRTYRPQTIADLDSPKLRESLSSILKNVVEEDSVQAAPVKPASPKAQRGEQANSSLRSSVPHSFLFTGPKGLGKTSTARIIAKILNCVGKKRDGIEPCNECEQCVSITNGNNIDVLEIDGASNRGIDEIRELRDRVKLAPSSAKKKVYIIDEVHMLTTEAFNALLKTIEEPPSHVVFIFCTTEPQKVPPTIISRCCHISLTRATDEELIHSLKRIIGKEKIDIDDDALALIAHLGDGGFRDTQKLFEEVIAQANGEKITKQLVEEKTKVGNTTLLVEDFLKALSTRDAKKGLSLIGELVVQGTDIKYFIAETLHYLHALVLEMVGVGESTKKTALSFRIEELTLLVELLQQAHRDSKYAVLPQLPLELLCINWCSIPESNSVGQEVNSQLSVQNDSKHTMDSLLKKERTLKVQTVLGKIPPVVAKVKDTSHTQVDLPQDGSSNMTLMENIIYKVKPFNHSVAGVLRGCIIREVNGESIIFETAYKFHKERLDENKTKEILEKIIREITGKAVQVMVELKK